MHVVLRRTTQSTYRTYRRVPKAQRTVSTLFVSSKRSSLSTWRPQQEKSELCLYLCVCVLSVTVCTMHRLQQSVTYGLHYTCVCVYVCVCVCVPPFSRFGLAGLRIFRMLTIRGQLEQKQASPRCATDLHPTGSLCWPAPGKAA